MIDHCVGFGIHAEHHAIIGTIAQPKTCDNRDCDSRKGVSYGPMVATSGLRPEAARIFERIDAMGIKQRELAAVLGIEENKVSKVRSGERQFKAGEVLKANEWLDGIDTNEGFRVVSDLPPDIPDRHYLPVEVLPTFAGMGGALR